MTSFYSREELATLGLKSYGEDVLISRNASIYGAEHISVGSHVRVDDFCILSGNITLGSHIHISAYVALYGKEGIVIDDYSGVSPKSTIYSAMDDFSGAYLIGPMNDEDTTNLTGGTVHLKRFVQVGDNSTVFPNLTIGEGTVIGAHSLVNRSLPEWGIYIGTPARKLKERSKELLKFIKK